jgi:hypothetical protein
MQGVVINLDRQKMDLSQASQKPLQHGKDQKGDITMPALTHQMCEIPITHLKHIHERKVGASYVACMWHYALIQDLQRVARHAVCALYVVRVFYKCACAL